jgi:hypothetical protein
MTKQAPNPFHDVYNAMTPDEQQDHIRGHAAVVEAFVSRFEQEHGTRVNLIEGGVWGSAKFYDARIGVDRKGFAIDRKHTVIAQTAHLEYYLGILQAEHELRQIIRLHGTTDRPNPTPQEGHGVVRTSGL